MGGVSLRDKVGVEGGRCHGTKGPLGGEEGLWLGILGSCPRWVLDTRVWSMAWGLDRREGGCGEEPGRERGWQGWFGCWALSPLA